MAKFLAATKAITFIREFDKAPGQTIFYETNRKYFKATLVLGDKLFIRVQGNNHVYKICTVVKVIDIVGGDYKYSIELNIDSDVNFSPNWILYSYQIKAGAEFGRLKEQDD